MTDPLDFKQIERKIFLSYHEDGLIDMMFGLVFFAFGLGILLDILYLGAISAAISVSLYMGLKRLVTVPRIGYLQMSKKGAAMKLTLALLTVGLLLLVLVFLYVRHTSDDFLFVNQYSMSILGVVIALPVIGVALYTGLNRFFLHAVLLFAGFASLDWTENPWGVGIAGLVVLLIGFALLVQFIRRYPIKEV